jgi:hypothetical protein
VGCQPIAFPLSVGPFGQQPFDGSPDHTVNSLYRDGYQAYVYLGPLEGEVFSPLISLFYTDEFVKELDRRYRLMYGKGLMEGCRLARLDAASFVGWMKSWGRPRREWRASNLGPITAWHLGGRDWKKTIRDQHVEKALADPAELKSAARRYFEVIRTEEYDRFLEAYRQGWPNSEWKRFGGNGFDYQTQTGYPDWVRWMCETFDANPIASVELGKVFDNNDGLPTVPYKLTLQDGSTLKGDLPFDYRAHREAWYGKEGIDWHLKYPKGLPRKK